MLWVSTTGPSAALGLTLRDTRVVILHEEEFELLGHLGVNSLRLSDTYMRR